ncbi:hypothetical protein [Pseudomonas sp. BE134]|uniref:hypothetical protein n=1 Tax=Pseudomonas sp. BE134 TaxID=2817843 RepID=UPI00285E560E|nr:hypothetical protein [Pseudomonas sp. BE134]
MRKHQTQPPSLQIGTASPAKALAPCTKRGKPRFCLYINKVKLLLFMSTPIFPWMSCKRRLAPIAPFCSSHLMCYVEVFADGAAAVLHVLTAELRSAYLLKLQPIKATGRRRVGTGEFFTAAMQTNADLFDRRLILQRLEGSEAVAAR